MKIEPFDPPHRFLVRSQSKLAETHLVDLEEYEGYGECSCEYWHFNIGPKLKQNIQPKKQCRHLRAVKAHQKKQTAENS